MGETPPVSASPSVLPKEKKPEKTISGDFRAVYRVVTDEQATAQGPQFILRKKVCFGEDNRWCINGSAEFNLFWFRGDLKSGEIPQNFLFPGTRSTTINSKLYTDIINGTQSTHNLFASQNIFELFLLYELIRAHPIKLELGLRAGFLAYWTKVETTSEGTGGVRPAEHVGKNKCIPGDIYCQKAPIPVPTGGLHSYTLKEETSEWSFAPRFGPHAVLTWSPNDSLTIKIGLEYLVSGRGNQDYPFDHVVRAWIEPEWRFNKRFSIFVEPRYSAIWAQGAFRHRFDCSLGPKARWQW